VRGEAQKAVIPVAAGCLVNEKGEILIAQRPAGKIAAGKWEFPGGKIEPGETPRQALERELHEELGITVSEVRPLIRVQHAYADRTVLLDTWLVTRFAGNLHPHDSQALAWVRADDLSKWDLLAADRPIVAALRLPAHYVFTPPRADASIVAGLANLPWRALLRLRLPDLSDEAYESLARRVMPQARDAGLRVVLDRSLAMALACEADGWHATSRVVAASGPLPASRPQFTFASCHTAEELLRARQLGFDAAVLGPVQSTATHPDRAPLGWDRFESLSGSSGLPVYAIGGLGPNDETAAFSRYAQGVAGISAYWR
jgi:8-oxo-dGTP diphosphatase